MHSFETIIPWCGIVDGGIKPSFDSRLSSFRSHPYNICEYFSEFPMDSFALEEIRARPSLFCPRVGGNRWACASDASLGAWKQHPNSITLSLARFFFLKATPLTCRHVLLTTAGQLYAGSILPKSLLSASDPDVKHDRTNEILPRLPRPQDPLSTTGRYPPIALLHPGRGQHRVQPNTCVLFFPPIRS